MENMVSASSSNPLARDLDEVLEAMGPLWDELRNARIFITGGTGFFGCWLLETLLWANDRRQLDARLTVLTRDPSAFVARVPHLAKHSIVTLHPGDIRTFEFPEESFSHVVHAASGLGAAIEPRTTFDTIVKGTERTLELARRAGASRFLLTSSGAVYGQQSASVTHIDEDWAGSLDSTDPRNAYGEGKRVAELLCAMCADSHFHPTIARCFAFVGPYMALDAHFAIGNFIRDALVGTPIRVRGDGTPFRSYMYATDLVRWLWTILLRGSSTRPYNVGSPDAFTVKDVAQMVANLVVPTALVTIGRPSSAVAVSERYVPSVKRAENELGLRPTVPLIEGMRRTAAYYGSRQALRSQHG